MLERWKLAARPWGYSEIVWLWVALLVLMAAGLALQSAGKARRAHQLMALAGIAVTSVFAFHLVSHYARCAACSLLFDLCPNWASFAFLYDYGPSALVLAIFAFQEMRRFAEPRPLAWAAAALVVPLVATPFLLLRLHELEAQGKAPGPAPSLRWVYAALAVASAPFVMPALRRDHFGALGTEFWWDSISNQANSYVAVAVVLLFGQVFLYTLPRTERFWVRVAGLFLAFNCMATFLALWFAWYDGRFSGARRRAFVPGRAFTHLGAVLVSNVVAGLFGTTFRFTHVLLRAPEVVCQEGEVTRARVLPACIADLEAALPAREQAARAPGAGSYALALPGETRAAIALAREALAAGEADERDLVRRLGRQHGSDLPSCQEAASANYAVICECAEVTR